MKILAFVDARHQFIKAAAITKAIRAINMAVSFIQVAEEQKRKPQA